MLPSLGRNCSLQLHSSSAQLRLYCDCASFSRLQIFLTSANLSHVCESFSRLRIFLAPANLSRVFWHALLFPWQSLESAASQFSFTVGITQIENCIPIAKKTLQTKLSSITAMLDQ